MRLFVAIELTDGMKDALEEVQDALYDSGVRGNFTPAENMHLTLAFIGDYPDAQPVLDALASVDFMPFEIELEGMGCFGDLWWAGIEGQEALTALAHKVRRALADAGIPFDRKRFSPHITLIRRAVGKLRQTEIRPAAMTVDAVTLMRSDRGRNGMIYTALGVIEAKE